MSVPIVNYLAEWIESADAERAQDAAAARAEVRERQLAEVMSEPAGPTKRINRNRPRSGPVETGVKF